MGYLFEWSLDNRKKLMFGLGIWELLLILILLIFFFGSKRLPEIGKNLGASISEFKFAFRKYDHEEKTARETEEKGQDSDKREPLRLIQAPVVLSAESKVKEHENSGGQSPN